MVQPINTFLEDEKRDRLKDILTEADQIMRPVCHALTNDEQHRVLKPRKGVDPMMHLLFDVLQERGIDIPSCPVDHLKKVVHLEHQMHALMNQLDILHQLARDTYRLARGEAWDGFLNYYGILNSIASRSPEVKNRIKPLIEFMSNSGRKGSADRKNDIEEDDE